MHVELIFLTAWVNLGSEHETIVPPLLGKGEETTHRRNGRGMAMTSGPPCFALSLCDTKNLYLIRHGQGYHNTAARDRGRAAYKDASLMDARCVPLSA